MLITLYIPIGILSCNDDVEQTSYMNYSYDVIAMAVGVSKQSRALEM